MFSNACRVLSQYNTQLRLLYLLNNNFIHCSSIILTGLARGSLPLFVNATSVKVGYLWDTPRDENLHTSEVVMEKEHGGSLLRLVCSISPPLPTDEYHWELRNELVQWYKNGPKAETIENPRYWSNDMTRTAISFMKVTLDVLGTYSCSYGGLTSSIDVLGKNYLFLYKTAVSQRVWVYEKHPWPLTIGRHFLQ